MEFRYILLSQCPTAAIMSSFENNNFDRLTNEHILNNTTMLSVHFIVLTSECSHGMKGGRKRVTGLGAWVTSSLVLDLAGQCSMVWLLPFQSTEAHGVFMGKVSCRGVDPALGNWTDLLWEERKGGLREQTEHVTHTNGPVTVRD